jgi:hypothetical protein
MIGGLIEIRGTTSDRSNRRLVLSLIEKPALSQPAGPYRIDDATVIHRDTQIVTNTAAAGAGHVLVSRCQTFLSMLSLPTPL